MILRKISPTAHWEEGVASPAGLISDGVGGQKARESRDMYRLSKFSKRLT